MFVSEGTRGAPPAHKIAVLRLIIGAVQGGALYFLYYASEMHAWPATSGLLFAPLLFVALFIPLGVSLGVGNLRAATLAVWAGAATVVVAAVAHYGIWKAAPLDWHEIATDTFASTPHLVPSIGTFLFTAIWLFIAHVLVASGDTDRRFTAGYKTYFDVAWKLAVQLALGAVFVGVFWGLLWLGAELFDLIDLTFLHHLIEHEWFAIPATALASGAAVHLTDVRAALVRGVRTLILALLGWFLPLLAVLIVGFLAALLFTGLEPLWRTRRAAFYLLTAAGTLVILINAAYQDGDTERRPPRVLRYTGTLSALALAPLVALSAYALMLRVDEYGWTAPRVATAACIIVAAFYAGGYAVSAVALRDWLRPIEKWNVASAVLILLVLAAIFSPLADPDRIAVASQVGRLERGAVTPDKFDFLYLRWQSGRYGVAALERLATWRSGKYAADIRSRVAGLLEKKTAYQAPPKARALDIVANVRVFPKGANLPADFVQQNWNAVPYPDLYPDCIRRVGVACDAYLLDLTGNGTNNIVIMDEPHAGMIFGKDEKGTWRAVGLPGPLWSCAAVIKELKLGHVSITPPAPKFRDVTVKGALLTVIPPYDQTPSCPD